MIKILIADDHAIVREGLKQIIADIPDMIIAGEASTAQEVLKKVLNESYDLVLLDITMPDASGLDILKDLRSQKPDTKILILSMHPEERYAVRVLRAGALGYVTKDKAPEELVEAIKTVSQGRRYISPSLAEKLVADMIFLDERPLHTLLSDREYSVMVLIASGKTMTEIASDLCLSIKTISGYKRRVLTKMKMHSNTELVRYALEHQLIG
jgi:two-component system invasion response regulator UvrY